MTLCRYGSMTPEYREEVGFKCKKLIDMARVHYLREYDFDAQLLVYADLAHTLENVVLVARNTIQANPAGIEDIVIILNHNAVICLIFCCGTSCFFFNSRLNSLFFALRSVSFLVRFLFPPWIYSIFVSLFSDSESPCCWALSSLFCRVTTNSSISTTDF